MTDLFPEAEHLLADRNADLGVLDGQTFDATVERLARGGEVLAPGPQDAPFQAIDGRDLGAFMLRLLVTGTTGAFHWSGPAA